MSTEPQASLISMIPIKILKKIEGKKVIETGFATGPGCCAGKVDKYDPPTTFEQGMAWLEYYREYLKGGSIVFEDRSILWFRWSKFERYQPKPAKELPRPGVTFPGTDLTLVFDMSEDGIKARAGHKGE